MTKRDRALALREIGNRLRVSRTAPYAHFKDKAALLAVSGRIHRVGKTLAAAESGPVFQLLTDTIREGQQQSEVRPGDPSLLVRFVWALVHGASMLQRESAEPQFIRFSNEVLRYGLDEAHGPSISTQVRG